MTQDSGIELFGRFAQLSASIQQNIVRSRASPNESKTLRLFPMAEAARLIGVSEGHLRTITRPSAEGPPPGRPPLPSGTVIGGNNRRAFTLAEINEIRRGLYEATGDRRYLPHRTAGEKLQVVAVANFKGGAAKTTTAVHLAQYLALRGYRVLLVDLDSQASLTALFGLQPDLELDETDTLYPYFRDERKSLKGLPRRTYWDGLDLIPANLSLYHAEFELPIRQMRDATFRFWRVLEKGFADLDDAYDVVICDCPPSLGFLTINAIYAATALLIPVPPSMIDFASTGQFFRMMEDTLREMAKRDAVKHFDFVRVLVSKYNTTDLNHRQIARWMAAAFGDLLLESSMVLTTSLDTAGNRKETFYEAGPAGNRKTYLRGLEHFDAVNGRITELLEMVWGRTTKREAA